ncbi:MAG TPA: NAD(P)H-binding protein, partial [Chitinophagaceae bacterium]|nr:NAD(P)H-binding protein [Chitinophagaceae bacterium]
VKSTNMKALIIGATGATGKDLVNILLKDPDYTEVVVFVRRQLGLTHHKLLEIITDFDNPETVSESMKADVLFSCLGTTLKAAGSKDRQRHIDCQIPLQFATIAKRGGVSTIVLLSAYGASSSSRVFYLQIKGALEDAISQLQFRQCIIFRPGLLLRKDTDRAGERVSAAVIKLLNNIGLMKRFKPMPTSILAKKLVKAPKVLPAGKHEIVLDKIFNF